MRNDPVMQVVLLQAERLAADAHGGVAEPGGGQRRRVERPSFGGGRLGGACRLASGGERSAQVKVNRLAVAG